MKQDRQGVRKASELEQKYNFTLLSQKGGQEYNKRSEQLAQLAQAYAQFSSFVSGRLLELTEHGAELVALMQAISQQGATVETLSQALTVQEEELTTLTQTISQQGEEQEALAQEISQQGETIATLLQTLTTLTQTVSQQGEEQEALAQEISQQGETIATLLQTLTAQEETMEVLMQTVAELETALQAIEGEAAGKHEVTFFDENGIMIFFYNVRDGTAVNPPAYAGSWEDENGNGITFPYTPTADIDLFAVDMDSVPLTE